MSPGETRAAALSDPPDDVCAVYGLAEQARLRCEHLAEHSASKPDRAALRRIHRELGMVGWLAGAELDSGHRRWLLADAHERSQQTVFGALDHAHALVATVILAEDVLAGMLTDGVFGDRWYPARRHPRTAEALLYAHLHPGRPTV